MDRHDAVLELDPIRGLPEEVRYAALRLVDFQVFRKGEIVYAQGRDDNRVHYLIDGDVDIIWNGVPQKRFSALSSVARRPLDSPGRKRYTVRCLGNVTIARFDSDELNRLVFRYQPAPSRRLDVSELATDKSSNWMIRMLESDLFSGLPRGNVQRIFARLEELPVKADQAIVRQGETGNDYFIIERGYCEVTRRSSDSADEIHLADLGPGDAFGEEALISRQPRSASVTMLTDGCLMRLSNADFSELVRDPLLKPVSAEDAWRRVRQGAIWVDLRPATDAAPPALKYSVSMTLNNLRSQARKLSKDYHYIVYSDDPQQSAIGAFLLAERGFDAACLETDFDTFAGRYPDMVEQAGATSEQQGLPEKVVSFPGAEMTNTETALQAASEDSPMNASNDDSKANKLENTIMKIDRLYSDREAEVGLHDRTPVDAYADTATGRSLADLISEMDEDHHTLDGTDTLGLPEPGPAPVTEQQEGIDLRPLDLGTQDTPVADSAATEDLEAAAPAEDTAPEAERDTLIAEGPLADELAMIVRDAESRIRAYLERAVNAGHADLEARVEERAERIREAAALQVRKKEAAMRAAYRARYKDKELQLRAYYKKLIALANKISKQKAQLQNARKQFEDKLDAANELYRQVESMRGLLREHVGNLDEDLPAELEQLKMPKL